VKLDATNEDTLVRQLTRGLPAGSHVFAGAGVDDCAVIRVKGTASLQLLKTDCVLEGVHFLRSHPPDRVGWKALCRAISDIAASGGKPDAAVITLAMPGDLSTDWPLQFQRGLRRAARRFGVSIVGGETARSPRGIFVSVALTGWVERRHLVLRSGGKAGDLLFVTGRLGGAVARDYGGRHLSLIPRVAEVQWLVQHTKVHAMMDLSDGLGADLQRLADASRAGYEIDLDAIPRTRGCDVRSAISDGEDYELLLAVPPRSAKNLPQAWRRQFPRLPLTCIGRLTSDVRARTPLTPGYSHFSGCQSAPVSG